MKLLVVQFPSPIALMMEAVSTSETSVTFYESTRGAIYREAVIFILATVRT
jgi:hypothetical protein